MPIGLDEPYRVFISEDPLTMGSLLLGSFKPAGFRSRSQKSIELFQVNYSDIKEKLFNNLILHPLEQNRFVYTANNPTNYIDPFGYKKCAAWWICFLGCETACDLMFGELGPPAWMLCFISCEVACKPVEQHCCGE
jgi:hypothetical protein